jgi:hypothetical protein
MSDVIRFMRSFPLTPQTVCTEAPMAWLAQRCGVTPATAEEQRATMARFGYPRGLYVGCERHGLAILDVDALDALEGAAVIAASADRTLSAVGILAHGGLVVAASFGRLIVAHLPLLRVIRPVGYAPARPGAE